MDINALITQILRGDRQAYAQLVSRYQDGVFAFLWRMGLRRAVVEELAQDTFVRAWAHLAEFNAQRAQFSTWLFAIARHLALNELGRAGARLEVPGEDDAQEPDANASPLEALARKRSALRLHAALRRLEPVDRSVLALSYLSDMSLNDIAALEGASVGAIKVRLHRARARLRQSLENDV